MKKIKKKKIKKNKVSNKFTLSKKNNSLNGYTILSIKKRIKHS
jgi:hypothetical protein